jgi:hypothetical protein
VASENSSPLLVPFVFLGCLLSVGLIVGGWLLGTEIRDIKLADRSVTVKGLVERVVKSDTAIWTISFKETGDDVKGAYAQSSSDEATVRKFLVDHGVKPSEITPQDIDVTDRLTANFGNANRGPRFVLEDTLVVSTSEVDKVASAISQTSDLLDKGIVLSNDKAIYKFSGLNALKPDMITEATRNARSSAARFAADSGARVGSIRSASQGVFSISAANETSVNADDGGGFNADQQADSSIMKKVRVVSTIDYYLVN